MFICLCGLNSLDHGVYFTQKPAFVANHPTNRKVNHESEGQVLFNLKQ